MNIEVLQLRRMIMRLLSVFQVNQEQAAALLRKQFVTCRIERNTTVVFHQITHILAVIPDNIAERMEIHLAFRFGYTPKSLPFDSKLVYQEQKRCIVDFSVRIILPVADVVVACCVNPVPDTADRTYGTSLARFEKCPVIAVISQ